MEIARAYLLERIESAGGQCLYMPHFALLSRATFTPPTVWDSPAAPFQLVVGTRPEIDHVLPCTFSPVRKCYMSAMPGRRVPVANRTGQAHEKMDELAEGGRSSQVLGLNDDAQSGRDCFFTVEMKKAKQAARLLEFPGAIQRR